MGNDARKRPGKRATAILELHVGISSIHRSLQCRVFAGDLDEGSGSVDAGGSAGV